MKNEALYPFGYGLSYTTFELNDIICDAQELSPGQEVLLEATLKNAGEKDGAETIQVYVKSKQEDDLNYQLKGLKKLSLKVGEAQRVKIVLPIESFGIYNKDGKRVLKKGDYHIYIGISQPDLRSVSLIGKKPECITISYKGNDIVLPE